MSEFESRAIKKSLYFEHFGYVVLIDKKMDKHIEPSRNIYMLNPIGDVVWQIDSGFSSHGVVGYSDIYFDSNNRLMAYSSNGVEYEIDPQSGHIIGRELIR